jgi:riboflavin transporter FmnP
LIVFSIVPFNILKAIIISMISIVLFVPLKPLLIKFNH